MDDDLESYDEWYPHELYDQKFPDCKHEIEILWSGVKCNLCEGWFCF